MKTKLLILAALLAASSFGALDDGFFVGVNFWGSKAGIHMWRAQDWNAAEIEKDLDAMQANGVELMRVFPTWPDFQTQIRNYGQEGRLYELLDPKTERPLYDPLWLDPEAMARFRYFCDACQKRNIRLLVSIVTGWMSGRLFVPPALNNLNRISDPEALMWEGRFVRGFVRKMKDHPAIVAWDLGNECNCMDIAKTRSEVWNWLNTISSAIRLEDATRPVVSGMHSQTSNGYGPLSSSGESGPWTLQLQREFLDVLTPHPYPACWRVDANRGPFNGFRNALHPISQCLFYEGVAGKPAFAQEVGSFGPTVIPDDRAALGMRMQIFACWQHATMGYLWWCAFRQMGLTYPPFCNNAMERELGLVQDDAARTPLPQARVLRQFKAFKDSLPFKRLPKNRTDAVVLLSEHREFYHQAFGAFMLAKQAGFDVRFCGAESCALPDAKLYVVPSDMGGWDTYSNSAWDRIMKKAEAGATVLVTRGGSSGYSTWRAVTGLEQTVWQQSHRIVFELDGHRLVLGDSHVALQEPHECEVLARDTSGNVVLSRKTRGKGQVIVCNAALEKRAMASEANVFEGDFSNELWRIYAFVARAAGIRRLVTRADSQLVVTEHPWTDGKTLVCALNTRGAPVTDAVAVSGRVGRVWNGSYENGKLSVAAQDGCIFEVLPR